MRLLMCVLVVGAFLFLLWHFTRTGRGPDEATDAFCEAWEDGPPDASTWELVPPAGEGWFLGSVHPREDGV